jgi:hypothetical protein
MSQKIEFRQVRDFGELVNDTFTFIKQNFKPLLKAVITICGFFLLACIVTGIFQQMRMFENLSPEELTKPGKIYGWEFSLQMIFMLLFYNAMGLTVFSYISLYREKGNQPPETEEVWASVKYFFWRFLGASILFTILFAVGLLFCVVPGIYLFPIISLMYAIIVFENTSLGYAFDRGFKLIKNYWWTTFGAMVIVLIVVYAGSMIFILPASFVTAGSILFNKAPVSTPVIIISTLVQSIAQIFMILVYVVSSLCYFSLNEIKEGSGLMDKVNMIGQNDTGPDLPEEQY